LNTELKALLWDVDGTLIDNEELHRKAFNAAFDESGLGWHWSMADYSVLLDVTGGRERITHFVRLQEPHRAALAGFPEFVVQLHTLKTRIYGEMLASDAVTLRPGVARLVREAADEGVRQAIVTTTRRINVDGLLERYFGAAGSSPFSVIASGERVQHKKPAPDLYHLAIADLDLPGVSCLAIEDSANGLRAASAALVPVIITTNGYTSGEAFEGALAVVDHLGDPGTPSRCLQGSLDGASVDLAQLRHWHRVQSLRT